MRQSYPLKEYQEKVALYMAIWPSHYIQYEAKGGVLYGAIPYINTHSALQYTDLYDFTPRCLPVFR